MIVETPLLYQVVKSGELGGQDQSIDVGIYCVGKVFLESYHWDCVNGILNAFLT
jgi:hypothetical protein